MKIAQIPKFEYKPGQLGYFQFIRGGIGADYHQGPAFYQFPDGAVRMIWGAYDFDECSPNVVLLYSDSLDGGIKWSDPQVYMADFPGGPLGGQMLRLGNSSKTLILVQQSRHEIGVDEETRVITSGSNYFESSTRFFIRWSKDGGRTFLNAVELPYKQICGVLNIGAIA